MKIVVFNCDCYADVSAAWLEMYKKYWPEQPYEVVYVTNSKPLKVDAEVVYIRGNDREYARRLHVFLRDYYRDDLVLLVMADYLIKYRADHKLIKKAEELCGRNIAHCRLRPIPKPQYPFKVDGFGAIEKGSRYSLSLQPGIWKVSALQMLIDTKENPWQMEVRGSRRTVNLKEQLISTQTHALNHVNYYLKGRTPALEWTRDNVPEHAWPDAVRRKYGRKRRPH
jgi:hypothetical protein